MTDIWQKHYLLNSKLQLFKKTVDTHKRVIDKFMNSCNKPYLSFSGGKDSSAMLCLFSEMGITDVPVFTQADDFDWHYKRELCHKIINELGFGNYNYIESNVSVLEMLSKDVEGVPMEQCWEDVVRGFVKTGQYDGFAMGIRQEESKGRRITLKLAYGNGLVRKCADGLVHAYPMAFFKGEDVFSIILSRGIQYAEIYDRHEDLAPHQMRFSWIFKPGITHSVGGIAWLKKNYPEQFRKLITVNPLIHSMA
jgi:3'-phosphoadenosine 5'-phosphosulfate sulfotransferase (PAPS reductase)/FAD synthetase